MNGPRALSPEDIARAAVANYVPARLPIYDELVSRPLGTVALGGTPILEWTDDMRATLLLFLWTDYEVTRPN